MSLKDFRAQGVAIEGMESLTDTLSHLLPREVMNLSRTSVNNVAMAIRDEMKKAAPKDTGTLRKAIVANRGKPHYNRVHSDVLITKGRGQANDAYYWHFVEWGTVNMDKAKPFVVPTIERMTPKVAEIFAEKMGANLEKLMAKKAAGK